MEDAEFARAVFLARHGIPFSEQETMKESALTAAFNLNLIWENPQAVTWHSGSKSLQFRTRNG